MNLDTRDDQAVRGVVADTERLQSDTEGFTRLLTKDVVIVNIAGRRVQGRVNIYEAMRRALGSPLARVLTRIEVEDVRFLRPDIATVGCIKHVSDGRDSSPTSTKVSLPERGRVTFVLVKGAGAWLVASIQTTPIQP
jgi:uncharacterized protein (TIGR02246 family)